MKSQNLNFLIFIIFILIISLAYFVSNSEIYLSPPKTNLKQCPLAEDCAFSQDEFPIRGTATGTTLEGAKQKSLESCNQLLEKANSDGNKCVEQEKTRCESENCQFNAEINSVNSCNVECCWGVENSEYKTEIYDVKCNLPSNLENTNQEFWACSSSADYFKSDLSCN